MIRKCETCGCYNEPQAAGWEMVEHSSGFFKYPEMKEECPVCGSSMSESDHD